MDKNKLIENLKEKREEVKRKLDKRRLDMVDQDGPMQSIGITATRWMVEQEIDGFDKELARLDRGIKEMKKIINDKSRSDGKYFVADEFEYLELGIISAKSEMGKKILERKT